MCMIFLIFLEYFHVMHQSIPPAPSPSPGQFFYAHFKMAATYRCRLVTSINTRFSTGIYQKNLLLLPVKEPL